MSGILVDSDVLIDVLRRRKEDLVRNWVELATAGEPLFYSPVSLAEIRHGMREREREGIERLFAGMTCLPIDEEAGSLAGDYLRAFHASHSMALGDALIAATASVHRLALWTQNHKHFPMKDVRFFEPTEQPDL
ncbi:MAG: type II toxin-antitoxin system VapC family toxin [Acidobacteriia bacterium]|nr:type II toxin-antitoxin system VapC family toxin [Terriglobia bacterium]